VHGVAFRQLPWTNCAIFGAAIVWPVANMERGNGNLGVYANIFRGEVVVSIWSAASTESANITELFFVPA
jgi:hypothetical protein